jgi:hypothetical protein
VCFRFCVSKILGLRHRVARRTPGQALLFLHTFDY